MPKILLIEATGDKSSPVAFFIPFLPRPGVIKANRRGSDPRQQRIAEKGRTHEA